MEMPKPSKEIAELAALFSGTWKGEATLHPSPWDPNGGKAYDTWVVYPSLDGFYVMVDYVEERDGRIVYRGHGVHGTDRAGAYLTMWFDNMGGFQPAPHRATLDGGTYEYVAEEQGGKTRFRYVFDGDVLSFSIHRSGDGASWKPFHEGVYRRVR